MQFSLVCFSLRNLRRKKLRQHSQIQHTINHGLNFYNFQLFKLSKIEGTAFVISDEAFSNELIIELQIYCRLDSFFNSM